MPMILPIIAVVAADIGAAVTAVAVAAAGATLSITGSAAIAAAVGNFALAAIPAAVELGATAGVSALLAPRNINNAGSPQLFKANPNAPIPIIMGRYGVGGNLVYETTSGGGNKTEAGAKGNEYLTSFVILSGNGPVELIESLRFNDTILTFDPNGQACNGGYIPADEVQAWNPGYTHQNSDGSYVNNNYQDHAWQNTQLGAMVAPYFSPPSKLASDNAGLPEWTSAHGFSSFAASALTLVYDQRYYAGGVPQYQWVVQGHKLYDPRKDSTYPGGNGPHRWAGAGATKAQILAARATWEFSQNPHIHALNYALGYYYPDAETGLSRLYAGIGAGPSGVVTDAFVRAANVADANGWVICGQWTTGDGKWSVLTTMLGAGGGSPVFDRGLISCIVSTPLTSLGTVTADDLSGAPITLDTGSSMTARINTIFPRFTSEAHRWQMVQADTPVKAQTYVTEDGGVRPKTIDWQYVPAVNQACQLAAYTITDGREITGIVLPGKPKLRNYSVGDCFTVDIPEAGLATTKVMVTKRSTDPMSGGVTLTVRTETDAKHAYSLGLTGVAPATPGISGYDPTIVAAPLPDNWATGVLEISDPVTGEATSVLSVVGSSSDDVYAQTVVLRWRPVTVAGSVVTPTGTGAWTYRSFAASTGSYQLDLNAGAYDVQIGYVSVNGSYPVDDADYTDLGVETIGGSTSADTAALGGRSATTVLTAVDVATSNIAAQAAQVASLQTAVDTASQQIADFTASYGDTDSAAESASAAQASATAAATAQTNAQSALSQAQTAVTAAQAAQTAAGNSATASANSAAQSATSATTSTNQAASATQSAGLAANSQSAAAGSATAASGSASTAATQATAAGNSATAAQGFATTASSQAANALSSANAASGFATSAATSATTAGNYSSAAQTASTTATATAAQTFPSTFSNPSVWSYAYATQSSSPAIVGDARFVTSSAGDSAQVFRNTPGADQPTLGTLATFVPIAGRTYQVTLQARVIGYSGVNSTATAFIYGLAAASGSTAGLLVQSAPLNANVMTGDVWYTTTLTWSPTAAYSWARPLFNLNAGSGTQNSFEALALTFADITESTAALTSATAAASSATTAAAQNTAAGQQASAASTSATNAQTYAGQANTSASNAATSASNAAGSSNTASTNATNASNSATAAGGSASAAASSASTASTQATNASNSASSATSSANTATSAAGTASGAATTATNQASAAQSSAASASSSASAAGQYASVAASTGIGSLNKSPTFADYASATGIPANWSDWSSGATGTRVTGTASPYAYQQASTAGANAGIVSTSINAPLGWYVIEADIQLISGTLVGAGVGFYGQSEGLNCSLSGDLDTNKAVNGAGTAGAFYHFRKLVEATVSEPKTLYLFTAYSGLGSTATARTIAWSRCDVRVASSSEINGDQALTVANAVTASFSSFQTAQTSTNTATAQSLSSLNAAVFTGASGSLQSQISTNAGVQSTNAQTFASQINSLQSVVGTGINGTTLTASVTSTSQTVATLAGQLYGSYTLNVTAGSVVTGMQLLSASGATTVSAIIFQAENFLIKSSSGSSAVSPFAYNSTTGTLSLQNVVVTTLSALSANLGTITAGRLSSASGKAYLDLDNAELVFNNGTIMKVVGVGAGGSGFGANGDLIEWTGPSMAISACTKANATISYTGADGSGFYGGAFAAGQKTSAAQNPTVSSSATISSAAFPYTGKGMQVIVGFSYYGVTTISAGQGDGSTTTGSNSATVTLYRSINGAAAVAVGSYNFSGSWSNQKPTSADNGIFQSSCGGSTTFTDAANVSNGQSLVYTATITAWGVSQGGNQTQTLSISVNEP